MWHAYWTSKWRGQLSIHIQSSGKKFWLETQSLLSSGYREYSKKSLGVNLENRPRGEVLGMPISETKWGGISRGNWEGITSELRREARESGVLEEELRRCVKEEIRTSRQMLQTSQLRHEHGCWCICKHSVPIMFVLYINAQSNISWPHLLKWNKLSFSTVGLYRPRQDSLGGPCVSSTQSCSSQETMGRAKTQRLNS